jgi:phosphatidylglycerophosphate synthase
MKYYFLSKLKTYLGVGIVVFYLIKAPLVPINNVVLTLGAILLLWNTFEEYYYIKKDVKTTKHLTIIADIIIDSLVICFLIINIIERATSNYELIIQIVIILLFTSSIINYILRLKRKLNE